MRSVRFDCMEQTETNSYQVGIHLLRWNPHSTDETTINKKLVLLSLEQLIFYNKVSMLQFWNAIHQAEI